MIVCENVESEFHQYVCKTFIPKAMVPNAETNE